jgi:methionine-rich copper-binding protein CopC
MPVNRLGSAILPLLLMCSALPAKGHAILLSAIPASGQVVEASKVQVSLRFNSRIDAQRSRVELLDSQGKTRSLRIGQQSSPDSLTSEANELHSGAYVLRWQVLSADGHISRGEVPFHVR